MQTSVTKTRPTSRFYLVLGMALISLVMGALFVNVAAIQLTCFFGLLLVWSYVAARLNSRPVTVIRRSADRAFAREPFAVDATVCPAVSAKPFHRLDYSDQVFGNGLFYAGTSASPVIEPRSPDPHSIESVPPGETANVTQACTVRRRGVYGNFDSCVTSTFPFGLFLSTRRCQVVQDDVIVYPHPEHPPVLQQLFAVGLGTGNDTVHHRREITGEFRGLRDFTSGDPVKLIHWPLSERYQHLVVKDFDPSSPEEVIIIFHSFWENAEKRMKSPEYALQVLAGMFIFLHNTGTEVSFYPSYLPDWEEVRITDDPETLEAALESLARAEVEPMTTMEPLTELLDELPEDDRRVIVFSNSPKRHWRHLLGEDNALICLDCRLEIDLEELSAASLRRRLQEAGS